MSEETKNFSPKDVLTELYEQSEYAIRILRASRDALFESKVGKGFNGKPPRPVIMHAVSRALTDCKMPTLDYAKFHRGVISLCLFFLEDDDVNLALNLKKELRETDEE